MSEHLFYQARHTKKNYTEQSCLRRNLNPRGPVARSVPYRPSYSTGAVSNRVETGSIQVRTRHVEEVDMLL
jgi:hypothetical protein